MFYLWHANEKRGFLLLSVGAKANQLSRVMKTNGNVFCEGHVRITLCPHRKIVGVFVEGKEYSHVALHGEREVIKM